ncbi:MAG: SPOR domain-containing protein [Neisseria sp.]|nr:SPOR domain-containing protein [Neisseria sp.]
MNTQEEYEQLKRNNRRRLIGAIVVVVIAAAILLKVLNHRSDPPPVAQVDIGDAASATQTTELPNPLTASEVAPVTPVAGSDVAPIAPLPASEVVAPVEATPPPSADATPPADNKPATSPVIVKTEPKPNRPAKKLSPQEILDGKAGKTKAQPTTVRNTVGSMIQAGAFTSAQQAEVQRERLAKIGIQSKVYRADTAKGEVYRVRIGPIASDAEAQSTLNTLQRNGFDGIVIRK